MYLIQTCVILTIEFKQRKDGPIKRETIRLAVLSKKYEKGKLTEHSAKCINSQIEGVTGLLRSGKSMCEWNRAIIL